MNSSEVRKAIIGRLSADQALKALLPDGVFWNVAPIGQTRYTLVRQLHSDVPNQFGGRSFETFLFMVKATVQATGGDVASDAADRIDALLDNLTALTISGYNLVLLRKQEHIDFAEYDSGTSLYWQHNGGVYETWVTPAN